MPPRTIAGTITPETQRLVGGTVFITFGLLCVAIIASWIYLLAAFLGLAGTGLEVHRLFLAFGVTIVIGCTALWAAAQIDLITISTTVEKYIWTTLIVAILSASATAIVAELSRVAPPSQQSGGREHTNATGSD